MKLDNNLELAMLLDDCELERFVTTRVIKTAQFAENVVEFSYGPNALAYLQSIAVSGEKLPEVIFLDVEMPGMSGHSFLEEFENLAPEVKSHCKIVVLSSITNQNEINRLKQNQYVLDFAPKSLTLEYLSSVKARIY